MQASARRLTRRQALQALARAAEGGLISSGRAAAVLGRDPQAASVYLSRLQKSGWIARVRRGVYMILPMETMSARIEDPWVLGARIFSPCYIGGWSAAEHWGLTEQLFRDTFIVTAAHIRRRRTDVAGTPFRLARVSAKDLAGNAMVWRGAVRVAISDRERTIVDVLTHPDWAGGIRHAAAMLRAYRDSPQWNAERLLATVRTHGSGAASKRLGFLAETALHLSADWIDVLQRGRTRGVVRLDPSVSKEGPINSRWGLRINVVLGSDSEG